MKPVKLVNFELSNLFKVCRARKPKQEKIQHHRVKQVPSSERPERKQQVDDTKSTRVSTEKVTVSRRDVTQQEQMTERKSLKQQDIGRIVIDEIPEKKDESKREILRKEVVRKKEPDVVATRHEVVPREYVKEEVIKVRQSDVAPVTRKEITQRTDRVDGRQQVCNMEQNLIIIKKSKFCTLIK